MDVHSKMANDLRNFLFSFTIESTTTSDAPTFKLELLPLDDEFVSLQVDWRPFIPESTFFVKYRLKGDEEWISSKNMSIKRDSIEFIRLERNKLYEIVVVTIDCDRTNESDIIEITTKIGGKFLCGFWKADRNKTKRKLIFF